MVLFRSQSGCVAKLSLSLHGPKGKREHGTHYDTHTQTNAQTNTMKDTHSL